MLNNVDKLMISIVFGFIFCAILYGLFWSLPEANRQSRICREKGGVYITCNRSIFGQCYKPEAFIDIK